MVIVVHRVMYGYCRTPGDVWLLSYTEWCMVIVVYRVMYGYCRTPGDVWLLSYTE